MNRTWIREKIRVGYNQVNKQQVLLIKIKGGYWLDTKAVHADFSRNKIGESLTDDVVFFIVGKGRLKPKGLGLLIDNLYELEGNLTYCR